MLRKFRDYRVGDLFNSRSCGDHLFAGDLGDLFAQVSIAHERDLERTLLKHPEEEWRYIMYVRGAKIFKRIALGIFGHTTVKTLDEMAKLLYETGMADTRDDAVNLAPYLNGAKVEY
jgi:hypothetical protein